MRLDDVKTMLDELSRRREVRRELSAPFKPAMRHWDQRWRDKVCDLLLDSGVDPFVSPHGREPPWVHQLARCFSAFSVVRLLQKHGVAAVDAVHRIGGWPAVRDMALSSGLKPLDEVALARLDPLASNGVR